MKKIFFAICITITAFISLSFAATIGADILPGGTSQISQVNPASLFKVVSARDKNFITLTWEIPDTFYVYRDKVKLVLHNSLDGKMQQSILPNGVIENDVSFVSKKYITRNFIQVYF